MSLLGICNWALQQAIIGVWRKPRQPPTMPKTQDQISWAYKIFDWFLRLSLFLWIVFVRWMLRISDFIKSNEFELFFFSSRQVSKKPSSQYILWFLVILLICALKGIDFLNWFLNGVCCRLPVFSYLRIFHSVLNHFTRLYKVRTWPITWYLETGVRQCLNIRHF